MRRLIKCCSSALMRPDHDLSVSVGNEIRAFDQDRGGGAERGQRLFRFCDKLLKPGFCAGNSKHRYHGRLARNGVLTGLFADKRGITFEVEQIVSDLEGLANGRPIPLECSALRSRRRSKHSAGLAGEPHSAPVFIACRVRTSSRRAVVAHYLQNGPLRRDPAFARRPCRPGPRRGQVR